MKTTCTFFIFFIFLLTNISGQDTDLKPELIRSSRTNGIILEWYYAHLSFPKLNSSITNFDGVPINSIVKIYRLGWSKRGIQKRSFEYGVFYGENIANSSVAISGHWENTIENSRLVSYGVFSRWLYTIANEKYASSSIYGELNLGRTSINFLESLYNNDDPFFNTNRKTKIWKYQTSIIGTSNLTLGFRTSFYIPYKLKVIKLGVNLAYEIGYMNDFKLNTFTDNHITPSVVYGGKFGVHLGI